MVFIWIELDGGGGVYERAGSLPGSILSVGESNFRGSIVFGGGDLVVVFYNFAKKIRSLRAISAAKDLSRNAKAFAARKRVA